MFKRKYDFQTLDIGETQFFHGKIERIRSAASMWGTRYGVWLKVTRVPNGADVTRVESSFSTQRKVHVGINERLKRIEDGIRFLSLLVIQLKDKLP